MSLGDKECELPKCDLAGMCRGTNEGFTVEETRDECLTNCKNTPTCGWYSYDTVSGFCSLTPGCESFDESKPNYLRGEVGCDLDGGAPTDPGSMLLT